MPLDQQAGDVKRGLGRVFYSLLSLKRVDLHLRHEQTSVTSVLIMVALRNIVQV